MAYPVKNTPSPVPWQAVRLRASAYPVHRGAFSTIMGYAGCHETKGLRPCGRGKVFVPWQSLLRAAGYTQPFHSLEDGIQALVNSQNP